MKARTSALLLIAFAMTANAEEIAMDDQVLRERRSIAAVV